MKSYLVVLGLLAPSVMAQSLDLGQVGGPSVSGDVHIAGLRVEKTFRDAAINTPLGLFAIDRLYSTTAAPGWSRTRWFNSPYWSSALSSVAIWTHELPFGLPSDPHDASKSITITTPHGDKFSTEELIDLPATAYTLPTIGDYRIIFKNDVVTLISDGMVFKYEFAEEPPATPGPPSVVKRIYRLRSVSPDSNISHENCVVHYNLTAPDPLDVVGKATDVTCTGGSKIDIVWSASLDRVDKLVLSARNGGVREVMSYVYDGTGNLMLAINDGGEVERYEYDTGFRVRRTSLMPNMANTGYRTISDNVLSQQLSCNDPIGWTYFSGVGLDASPEGQRNYVLEVQSGACPSITKTTVSYTTAAGEQVATTYHTQNIPPNYTFRVDTECKVGGAECAAVQNSKEWWEIQQPTPLIASAYTHVAIDARANGLNWSVSGQSWLTAQGAEVRFNQVDGRNCCTPGGGGSGVDQTSFGWDYFEARGAHEPLLTVEQKPSAANPGATMEIVKRFDPVTKNLRSTIVHGWTLSMDEDGAFERALGVFFFESRTCTDKVADPLHRAVEIHGPCWVKEGSTDCDLEDPDEPTPISQIEYYPDELNIPNAGRPKLKRVFTRTSGLMCNLSDGLVTQYLQYDAAGHVLREVDPSGTVTERTYLGDKLATETIDGLTTTYWYSPAQGGRLSGIGKPTGEWTVYCYRLGSDLQSCTTGTPSDELQWEARIAGVGPGGGWSILQKTEYQYEPLNGAIAGSGGGRLVGAKTTKGVESKNVGYTYDALRRLSGEFAKSSITGTLLHGTPKLYDLTGHMIAEGLAYNNTPASCGGWKNPSKECTRYFYDEVNRIESVMKTGGSNPFVVNYGYDPRGALNSVSQAPGGQFASYVVDDFDQVVRIKGHWNTGAKDGVRQSFDAAGRLRFKQTSTQATLGDRTVYKYDAAGRPVSAEAYGYLLWAHGYDGDTMSWANCPSNTSPRLRGRRQWTDDSFGRTWYEYDSAGRVVAERRVRQGGTQCSASGRDSSETTPDTTFEFRSDGRLYWMKYPHGLELKYEWGENGRQDEIVAITHNDNGLGWKDLVANITYDVQGAIRSYEMGGDRQWAQEKGLPSPIAARYLMHRRQPVPLGEEGCTVRTDVSADGTGRPDTLVVTRPGGSNDENVFLRRFSWQADQLSGQSTCVLDDEKPTNESFEYDEHLQLKSAQRPGDDLQKIGGPYAGLDYSYTNATDRDQMVSNGSFHHASYDGSRRLDGWVDEYVSKITLLDYDEDGRVNSLNEAVYATNSFNLPGRSISFEPQAGLDGVYRSLNVGGAIYEYFYDAVGRRRLKISPDGNTDEFFYSGDNLIEDRGVMYYGDEKRILSQYVWLSGMPIAVIKRPISTEGEVWPDDSAECYRNDQEDPCGLFYVVNDFLPKPVALINAAGRLAGVGEYNPFGAVNTVRIGEDARPLGVSHDFPYFGYAENDNRVIAMIHQPPRTGQQAVRARIRMSVVNSFNVDRAHIEDPSGASVASSIGGQYAGAVMSKWFQVDEPGVRVRWETDSSTPKPLIGVSVDSYEYRRYEASLPMPSWIPLRFPGQYFDEETGLHENRNRFYSPELGRYLSADPLDEGEHGLPLSNNAYAYANSNPITMSDPLGLIVKNYEAMRARLAHSDLALALLAELNGPDHADMTYEFIFAPPPQNYLGQNMSKEWGLTDGRNATDDKVEKLIKIYINSDKLNAGDAKKGIAPPETTFEEVAAHEMSHATRWRPEWLTKGSEPETQAYDVQIKVRSEDLGLGINMRWVNEHPAWETFQNGMRNTPTRNSVIMMIQKNGEWRP